MLEIQHVQRQREAEPRLLANKTCLVTGSSRGIGRGIAESFAQHGATVIVNYNDSEAAADDLLDSIQSIGGDAEIVRADVSDYRDVLDMADRIHEAVGAIDVLVNNAGITRDARFEQLTVEDWRRVVDVNLSGAFYCTKAFYEDVRDAPNGRVINVSSIVGQEGNFGQANYAAAKSGLFGLTKSLALELAPSGSTANCVAPGFTETDMAGRLSEKVRERIQQRIPLNRFATVEEIVPIVRFLASDESSYVTGEIINVNGGMYA